MLQHQRNLWLHCAPALSGIQKLQPALVALRERQLTPKPMHKGLATATLLVPWMLWKHRNDCIFDRGRLSVHALLTKIKEEATLWASAGALGLRAVIHQTGIH